MFCGPAMAVNDGDKDGGNGEGRGHIGRRQEEGREVDVGRGASNLMQAAMRGSSEQNWRGERGVWVEERGTIGL
jgi:hypothetical protein